MFSGYVNNWLEISVNIYRKYVISDDYREPWMSGQGMKYNHGVKRSETTTTRFESKIPEEHIADPNQSCFIVT